MLFENIAGAVGKDQGGSVKSASDYVLGRDQDIAIIDLDQAITYGELRERTASLAGSIRQMIHGIENPVVVIAMPQGLDFIIALLGSLESGCLVIPLDMALPSKRMAVILEKANPNLVLSNTLTQMDFQSLTQRLNIRTVTELLGGTRFPISLPSILTWKGIVLYTSGSTGDPKGVLISRQMLIREARMLIDRLGILREDRISNLLSPSVIGGLREIFTGLLSGATLYPFRVKELGLNSLIKRLHREKITVCRMVSSLFSSLCHAFGPDDRLYFRRLYIGGEPLVATDVALFRKHFSPECQLSNVFGATEFGLVTHYVVPTDFEKMNAQTVPIGMANEGYRLTVVDDAGNEVSQGTPGKLIVAGECIAEGYWTGVNDPLDRFCEIPNRSGWRVFETADLVRLDSSGQLEYLGRSDMQTKIAGNRVELNQVENILRRSKDVLDAVVVSLEFEGRKDLYAIVERNKGNTEDLFLMCKEHLPDSSIPRRIIECSSVPKSFQGKCDRRAVVQLVQGFLEQSSTTRDCRGSSDRGEVDRKEILKQLWRRANRMPNDANIDPACEFQTDSLSTLDFLINIRKRLGIELSPKELNTFGTFDVLAKFIDSSPSVNNSTKQSHCVRLSEPHHGPALFLLHGTFGEVGIYTHLVDTGRLPTVTVYGFNVNIDFFQAKWI